MKDQPKVIINDVGAAGKKFCHILVCITMMLIVIFMQIKQRFINSRHMIRSAGMSFV